MESRQHACFGETAEETKKKKKCRFGFGRWKTLGQLKIIGGVGVTGEACWTETASEVCDVRGEKRSSSKNISVGEGKASGDTSRQQLQRKQRPKSSQQAINYQESRRQPKKSSPTRLALPCMSTFNVQRSRFVHVQSCLASTAVPSIDQLDAAISAVFTRWDARLYYTVLCYTKCAPTKPRSEQCASTIDRVASQSAASYEA